MQGRLVWASLRTRRARVVLAIVSVTLGVGVAIALGTLALRVGDDLARNLRGSGPNFVLLPAGATWAPDLGGADYVPARAGNALRGSAVPQMKETFWRNNVLEAAPELVAGARRGETPFALAGTWFEHEVATPDGPWVTGLARLRPHWKLTGRWPRESEDGIVLGREVARRLGAAPGQTLDLVVAGAPARFVVTGVVHAGGLDDDMTWAPLARVQALAGRPEELDRVWFSALVCAPPTGAAPAPDDPEAYERFMCTAYPANVAGDLTASIPGAEARPLSEIVAGEARVVGRLHLLILLLALAALTASVIGLVSTTTASVVERRVEIGLLRTMGASPAQIAGLILSETMLIALVGGPSGWLAGSAAAAAIRGNVFGGGATFQPMLFPVALAMALAVAIVATLAPLRLALRLDPAAVLRG